MSSQSVSILSSVNTFLARNHGLFIGGDWVDGGADPRLSVYNPATGQEIATVVNAGANAVDRAVSAAHAMYESGGWSGMMPAERERILASLRRSCRSS